MDLSEKNEELLPILYSDLAKNYELMGELPKAEQVYKVRIEILKKFQEYSRCVAALSHLSDIYMNQKRYTDAETVTLEVIDLVMKTAEDSPSCLAAAYQQLAWIYKSQQMYEEAEQMYQTAAEMYANVPGKEHQIINCYENLGWICTKCNRLTEGEELFVTAMEIALLNERQDLIANLEENLTWNRNLQKVERQASLT